MLNTCKKIVTAKLLSPLSRKNEEYHETDWYTRYMHFKYDIICNSIEDGLSRVIQEEVEEKDREYNTIPPKDWIGIFRTLEAKDNRIRADREAHKTTTKKNKAEQPGGYYDNRKTIPRVPHKI